MQIHVKGDKMSEWSEIRVAEEFVKRGVREPDVGRRDFPDETIFIVSVRPAEVDQAIAVGIEVSGLMEADDFTGFITVRPRNKDHQPKVTKERVKSVHDRRATALVQLMTSRSRTSDALPSLHYVLDSSANLAAAEAPRHHLVLGRRGVGKTALLLEAKKNVEAAGHVTAWTNVQVLRRESAERVFLYVLKSMMESCLLRSRSLPASSPTSAGLARVYEQVEDLLAKDETKPAAVNRLIPTVQSALRRYLSATGIRLYVFLDDFYFVPRDSQPELLDALHSCIRDCDAWLKIASIQSLTRWFTASPPTGLQTGQDADVINLDVTLQDPPRAKLFLESILSRYAEAAGTGRLTSVFRGEALDRLVLACGGVPRDYLVLAAAAIVKAQKRTSGKVAGVQDVNEAAGDAAQPKILELEEDLSTEKGEAQLTVRALERLRSYCLDSVESSYYRVSFRRREVLADEYALLVALSELRLNHTINASLSDGHRAGEKYEVFMLDLSQFSGSRLKQGVEVLDLVNGVMVSKRTGRAGTERKGQTPRQLNTILRAAPELDLDLFTPLMS